MSSIDPGSSVELPEAVIAQAEAAANSNQPKDGPQSLSVPKLGPNAAQSSSQKYVQLDL